MEQLPAVAEIPVRIGRRTILSEAELNARFPKPEGVPRTKKTSQGEDIATSFGESPRSALFAWNTLPADEEAEVTLPRLRPVLSIVNIGSETIQLEPWLAADTGGPAHFYGRGDRLTLVTGEEVELEVDLDALGWNLDEMKFSGSVRATSTVMTLDGDSRESISSESLFFHKRGQSILAYNENRLRAAYRAGDFAGRIRGTLPPGLMRATDAGSAADPPPEGDGDSGDGDSGDGGAADTGDVLEHGIDEVEVR